MKASRKISRRSFAAAVLGTIVAGGATALVLGRAVAPLATGNGITDSDSGRVADVAANGRGTPRGYTDSDAAPVQDARYAGRGPGARSGPREEAPEPGGRARAAAGLRAPASNGCSDADIGALADPGGRGRACVNRRS